VARRLVTTRQRGPSCKRSRRRRWRPWRVAPICGTAWAPPRRRKVAPAHGRTPGVR
jgi:hypothetical protein